jgi:hypothetical protein
MRRSAQGRSFLDPSCRRLHLPIVPDGRWARTSPPERASMLIEADGNEYVLFEATICIPFLPR